MNLYRVIAVRPYDLYLLKKRHTNENVMNRISGKIRFRKEMCQVGTAGQLESVCIILIQMCARKFSQARRERGQFVKEGGLSVPQKTLAHSNNFPRFQKVV